MLSEIPGCSKERLSRQIALIGEQNTLKLINAKVCVVGLGGVGGYVCEMLSRAGVGYLCLVDCDTVSISNLNRQIIALTDTVGKKKTDAMAQRIANISPDCNVKTIDVFVTKENADDVVVQSGADIIIDAIDNVSAKVALALSANNRGKYIFSAMGAGNKLNISDYKIADISKTHTCGLARAVRRQLKDVGITHLDVLFSEETPANIGQRAPASICYMPSAAGLIIAEHIIKKIISDR